MVSWGAGLDLNPRAKKGRDDAHNQFQGVLILVVLVNGRLEGCNLVLLEIFADLRGSVCVDGRISCGAYAHGIFEGGQLCFCQRVSLGDDWHNIDLWAEADKKTWARCTRKYSLPCAAGPLELPRPVASACDKTKVSDSGSRGF